MFLNIRFLLFCFVAGLNCFGSAIAAPATKTGKEALREHVSFLAQPQLKGRKPRTSGSRAARRYIEARFKECGLVPWEGAKSYELSFGYGINVVGVLPGSDPVLKEQIVLVSAHYDHLGKAKGEIYPGAGDNASGVAAMLEVAREMVSSGNRPKRSVAFVAFDCEEMMLLGSFAFSCRPDVEHAKISAVVNTDMLGRDLLDVVRQTIFVAGTEQYPLLRERVREFGTNAGIRVLPVGTDLAGPRSDHAAFESRGVPCLFFSCGTFRDYHKPSDTADKLDYDELDHSTRVIRETVRNLAEGDSIQAEAAIGNGDREELQSVCSLLPEIAAKGREAGIADEDIETFKRLGGEAENLLATGRYDRETRQRLVVETAGVLTPYFLPMAGNGDGRATMKSRRRNPSCNTCSSSI